MRYLYTLLFISVSAVSYAGYQAIIPHQAWAAKGGRLIPDTDKLTSDKGFGGRLIITADEDWAEKVQIPSRSTPPFSETGKIEYGKQLAIISFYTNPLPDDSGNVNIACSIRITRPDNTLSLDDQIPECITGRFPGNTKNIYMTPLVIKYKGEPGDPAGVWLVEISLADINRDAHVYLKSEFTLAGVNGY